MYLIASGGSVSVEEVAFGEKGTALVERVCGIDQNRVMASIILYSFTCYP